MLRNRIILLITGISLSVILFYLPKVVVDNEEEELSTPSIEAVEEHDPKESGFDHEQTIDSSILNRINSLRELLLSSDNNEKSSIFADSLGFLFQSVSKLDSAAYYLEWIAERFPNEENMTNAGLAYYEAFGYAIDDDNEPVAVVDGNVFRVLSRIYGINANIGSTKGTKQFYELANELIDHIRPDSFNQAIMEFGALQCIPKNPDCENCSFAESCYARQHNLQIAFPVKKKKIKVRDRYFNYLVITDNDRLAMKMRADKDIWSGLYDYVLIETEQPKNVDELNQEITKVLGSDILILEESHEYRHILSHQRLHAKFIKIQLSRGNDIAIQGASFYSLEEIKELPKPVLVNKYLNDYFF